MKHWQWIILAAVLVSILIIKVSPLSRTSLNDPYTPIEHLYTDPAVEILHHGFHADLSYYAHFGISPLLTSLILAASYGIFGEKAAVGRGIILLFGILFSIFLYVYLSKKEDKKTALITSVLVASNPLFVTYTVRVSTDVIYMTFITLSMLIYVYGNSIKSGVVSAIMFSLALATKYNAVVLYPAVVVYSAVKNGFTKSGLLKAFKFLLWFIPLTLVIALPIILWLFTSTASGEPAGNTFMHWAGRGLFIPKFSMYLGRFFSYVAWLGLFVGLMAIFLIIDLYRQIGKKRMAILLTGLLVLAGIIAVFIHLPTLHQAQDIFGEMNLCGIEPLVPSALLSTLMFFALIGAELFIVSIIYEIIHHKNHKIIFLAFWTLTPIIFMAMTRSAQRYMLAVLVPACLYPVLVSKRTNNKWLVFCIVAIQIIVSFYAGYYTSY